MSIFRSIHLYNNDKVEKFHNSKEEAVTFLTNRAFQEFIGAIPTKGMNLEVRAEEARKRLPALLDKLEKIDEDIQEFKPAK